VFRRYLSAAFGVGISFFAAPATAGPDEIIDALLRCRPDFFEVLKTEKSAFAPALIRHREIPVSDIVTSLANIATFQESIQSRGVDIQVYLQTVISGSGDADRRRRQQHLVFCRNGCSGSHAGPAQYRRAALEVLTSTL
jgi:hypothetical protein